MQYYITNCASYMSYGYLYTIVHMQVMLTTRDWDALPSYSTPGKALQAQQQAQAQTLQRQQLQQQQQQEQQQQGQQEHSSSSSSDSSSDSQSGSDPAAKCPFPHS